MTVGTSAGTIVSIGTKLTAKLSGTDATDITTLAALTYTELGELITVGEYGDSTSDVAFTALAGARVTHLKGVDDGGTVALTIGFDEDDAGQAALVTAAKDRTGFYYLYPIKLEYPSGLIDYLVGCIMNNKKNPADGNGVVTRTVTLGSNHHTLEDA